MTYSVYEVIASFREQEERFEGQARLIATVAVAIRQDDAGSMGQPCRSSSCKATIPRLSPEHRVSIKSSLKLDCILSLSDKSVSLWLSVNIFVKFETQRIPSIQFESAQLRLAHTTPKCNFSINLLRLSYLTILCFSKWQIFEKQQSRPKMGKIDSQSTISSQ